MATQRGAAEVAPFVTPLAPPEVQCYCLSPGRTSSGHFFRGTGACRFQNGSCISIGAELAFFHMLQFRFGKADLLLGNIGKPLRRDVVHKVAPIVSSTILKDSGVRY